MRTYIIVPGHNTSKSVEAVANSKWEVTLQKEFGVETVVHYANYNMFIYDQVKTARDSLVNLIRSTSGEIVIFAYCFGGYLSRLALVQLSDEDLLRIKFMVTMATPHSVPNRRQRAFLQQFPMPNVLPVKTLACAGWLDPFAFPLFLKTEAVQLYAKTFLVCTHADFFYNEKRGQVPFNTYWIPAYAGMTKRYGLGIFLRAKVVPDLFS